jgi:selenocysteine lyase/cysteine desulfurase
MDVLGMEDQAHLVQLEELAERLGIKVRYEPLKSEGDTHAGGLCRINGKDVLIVNKKATGMEKRQLLVEVLKRYDLSGIYLLPSLRELLDVKGGEP